MYACSMCKHFRIMLSTPKTNRYSRLDSSCRFYNPKNTCNFCNFFLAFYTQLSVFFEKKSPSALYIQMWRFYIIVNRRCTYAGVSPTPERRLRQHNGEIKGGAKYPLSRGAGWEHVCLVSGFPDKIAAMQFEWAVKHAGTKGQGGLKVRMSKLAEVLGRSRWTSKSPDAASVPLRIELLPGFAEFREGLKAIDAVQECFVRGAGTDTDIPCSGGGAHGAGANVAHGDGLVGHVKDGLASHVKDGPTRHGDGHVKDGPTRHGDGHMCHGDGLSQAGCGIDS